MRYFHITLAFLIVLFAHAAQAQDLSSADEYTQRAMARFEKNDLDGAIADFTKVIELKGQNLEFCYYFRGMAQYRKGNLNLAVDDLTKALAIKSHPRFYLDRGNLLAKQGELERALADLNKAVELSPDAKAYGDRGLIRLMRGEETLAEKDFTKSFELDRTLEPHVKAAANRIKQRNVARQRHQPPSDIQIIKFSWKESNSSVVVARQSPVTTTTSSVSPSGTRLMADPRAKDEPGPYGQTTPTGRPPPEPETFSRPVLIHKFSLALKNTGSKTIEGVEWAYVFYSKDPARDSVAYTFTSRANIGPGKEKTLSDWDYPASSASRKVRSPTTYTKDLFDEKIVILRLDHSDATKWQSSPVTGATK